MFLQKDNALKSYDWNLLTLAAAGGEALTPAQLQKSLFLLGQYCPHCVDGDFYDFKPYNYGPFDRRVYDEADCLAMKGLARVQREGGMVYYSATREGLQRAAHLESLAPVPAENIRRIVGWARSLSFPQLIRAIYERFPEYRVNSVFQE